MSGAAAGLLLPLTLLVAGCSGSLVSARESSSFLDAAGQCPVDPGPHSPGVCERSRQANAVAGSFKTLRGPWGFAYAYNCGAKPGTFFVVAGLPGLDGQMVASGVMRTGRKGSGYQFVSPTMTTNATQGTTSYWVNTETVQMLSTCTWHIRAVAGAPRVVRAAIPPIPTSVNEAIAEEGAKHSYSR